MLADFMASQREQVLQEQSEPDDFVPFELTPEQRLVQRTVPFFLLPGYETVPNTANIKARVDTHNPSYKCPRPHSAAPQLQDKHPKQDYSHVVARVDTGRGHPLQMRMRKAQGSDGEVSSERWISTGSDEGKPLMLVHKHLKRRRPASAGPSITASRSTKGGVASSGQDLSQVRAKVDSLQNIHHQPGGGHVTIGKYPKPVIKATPKVNTVDNIKYLPSGGNVKYPTYETCHFKAEAKSKVDHSDPNPAHKLQHSIKELRITGARKLNPRLNPDLTKSTLYRSKTFDSSKQAHQATARDSSSSEHKAKSQLRKSATLDSIPSFAEVPLVVAEETNEHKPKSCMITVPDRVEQGNHTDTVLNEQTENYNHDTDEVVHGKKLEQNVRIDNGEGCVTIPTTFQTKTNASAGSEEQNVCSPGTTKELDSVTVGASNSETFLPVNLQPMTKGTDHNTRESPHETMLEGEHNEVKDTVSGTLLVPQVVVYNDDGTVVETIDAAKEKHYEGAQSETVERTCAYHDDGEQDNDNQKITKL